MSFAFRVAGARDAELFGAPCAFLPERTLKPFYNVFVRETHGSSLRGRDTSSICELGRI
jgi:hypothetical protein